jgi:hypothetical protein
MDNDLLNTGSNMKSVNLTDNRLSNDSYKSCKEVMEAYDATFTATELKDRANAIRLSRCRVEYDESVETAEFDPSNGKWSKHDVEAHWE